MGALTPTITSTLLAVMQVNSITEPSSSSSAVVKFDYPNDIIQVIFDTRAQNAVQKISEFAKQLQSLHIVERHENPGSMWFYNANGGDEILNVHNYPVELKEYLLTQSITFEKIIQQNGKFSHLVEVGCGDLENLKLAHNNSLPYLGLDFSALPILQALEKIRRKKIENADCKHLNILSVLPEHVIRPGMTSPVIIFPFNVFGNIAPITELLCRLHAIRGATSLISIYKTDEETNQMRKDYYEKCGYENIQSSEDETGMWFTSDQGLYTVAYSSTYLLKLFTSLGFHCAIHPCGKYGWVFEATSA
jgi:hypothetical protein